MADDKYDVIREAVEELLGTPEGAYPTNKNFKVKYKVAVEQKAKPNNSSKSAKKSKDLDDNCR